MAGIDDILAGQGGNTRADFSNLFSGGFDAYNTARDQKAKNDLRDAFKGGVPLTADGQPDFGSMAKTLFQKGDIAGGVGLIAPAAREREMGLLTGGPQPPIISPSASRPASVVDRQPRIAQGGEASPGAPQGQQQPTVMTILAQHVPNDQLQAASESVARQLGVDPTAPLDVNDPQVRNVLVPAIAQIKRMGLGQVQPLQPGDNSPMVPTPVQTQSIQPQQTAQPIKVAPQDDYELKKWTFLAASPDKQIAAAAKARLEALQKDRELTQDMKNAAASGQSLPDYQNRADENTTQRDILTKSLIPRVEKSQEKAVSAVEDIDAIHRSRGELDAKGGVITGIWAKDRLSLAKVGNFLGIADADKITNTEAFSAAVGKRVAAMVKAFGSGTAISDGDRRFAEKMAGGGIELNETSMRRILDIGEQADRAIIDRHNGFADKVVKANEGLKPARDTLMVPHPAQYKKPEASSAGVFDAARDAIAKGAPREAVMKRLRENGHDPAGL